MIRNSLKIVLLIADVMLCMVNQTFAAPISKAKLAQYAKLPDWSGIWALKGYFGLIDQPNATEEEYTRGLRAHPPYNAEWQTKYQNDLRRDLEQGNPNTPDPIVDSYTVHCATGMPRFLLTPFDYQFINSPGMTWIIAGGEVRQIYTDGHQRPDEDAIWSKIYGWSSGQWHGQILEVETTDVLPGLWADGTPVLFSDKARFNERIYLVDANTIQIDLVITDPVAFTRPWSISRQYVHAEVDWVDEKETCGGPNNRHPIVNGRLTTKLK